MILLEVVDAERRKVVAALTGTDDGPSRRRAEVVRPPEPSGSDPPDYATSQAAAETQREDVLKKPAPTKWSDRPLGRFIVYALVIYLVLSISIAVPLFIVLRNNERAKDVSNAENRMKNGGLPPPPPPPPPDILPPNVFAVPSFYGSPLVCNNWTHVGASDSNGSYFTLQYSLPLNDTLYIRSNFSDLDDDSEIYSPITGSLRVSVGNDITQTNATVTVKMDDIGEDALKLASVCLMGGNGTWSSNGTLGNGTWGVAIIVPDGPNEDRFYFDVNLELPPPQSAHPLNNLATYLPSFNQTFDQLDAYMNLNSVEVQGSLGGINIASMHARNILVKASAGSITGTFNVSDKLKLETVLKPISANISLYNEGIEQEPSQLNVETGNSSINVNVTLHGTTNDSIYCLPTFMSSLKTFSGPIEASYYHDSSLVSSVLYARATNSLEPARVFVDKTFEGTYDVHTTLAEAIVDQGTDLVDPSGAGRSRQFELDYSSPTRAYGWVGWGLRPTDRAYWQQGHIEVVSSLADAELQLTDVPDYSQQRSSESSKDVHSHR